MIYKMLKLIGRDEEKLYINHITKGKRHQINEIMKIFSRF